MAYLRRNVWELGSNWADSILWYARGVKAMRERPLADHLAWRFFGAIHGIDTGVWQQLGYLSPSDRMPSAADIATFWNQCQHGSWYFLPWHRGYLMSFEATVRDAVVKLGGPTDWALPYWNYFKPGENGLPPAFGSPDWPDGSDNPLYVEQRYGPNNDGHIYVPVDQVNLNALQDPDFAGAASGGSPGFGGVDTGFSHGGQVHGGLETQPHDWVHGLVGGGDPNTNLPGLMSDPDTAGLDPIFWLHHANIDRLWEVWRRNPPSHLDPMDPNWINGPAAIGERAFVMPMPTGENWTYTPGQMSDLSALGYGYDNYDAVSPAVATPTLVARLERLGVAPASAQAIVQGAAMTSRRNVELLGASTQGISIAGAEAGTTVALNPTVKRKVSARLRAAAAASPTAPDRVFLNLENVRGLNDAAAFKVYIKLPESADPAQHPEHLAGSIALFGARKATLSNGEHAGNGLTFVLEISHIIDALHLSGALDANQLQVRLVAVRPIPEAAKVSIGRISVFRQGT